MKARVEILFIAMLVMLGSRAVRAQETPVLQAVAISVQGLCETRHGFGEWKALEFGAVLGDSDQVRTGDDGFVAMVVTHDGTQMKIRPNSLVVLRLAREGDMGVSKKITLELGQLFTYAAQPKGRYEVTTPTSVAAVKGTEFWTLVNNAGGTTVLTQEGTVALSNTMSGLAMDVTAGQMGVSTIRGELTVNPIPPGTEIPSWPDDLPVYDWQPPEEPEPQPEPDAPQEEPGDVFEEPAPQPRPTPTPAHAPPMGGEEASEPPAEEPATSDGGGLFGGGGGSSCEGFGFTMNGAAGATVIEDQMYQYISFRPELCFWKFGVGFDLPVYFDADGNMRDEDWDFDETNDVLNKIYYIRYGQPGETFYARVGALENITLGYGLIMKRYTNALEWPQRRRIGMHSQLNIGGFGWEGVINDFSEIEHPGLIADRLTYEVSLGLPVVFGGTFAFDGNQYLGAKDTDDDGVADALDLFPGKNDYSHAAWLQNTINDPQVVDELIRSGDLPDINNLPPSITNMDGGAIAAVGVDVGVPLLRKKSMQLWLYGQFAQLLDSDSTYGNGVTVPGLSFTMGPFRAGAEYRIFSEKFLPEFFDMSYEIQRVTLEDANGNPVYVTKKSRLFSLPAANGFYMDAGFNIVNMVDVYGAYTNMTYDYDSGAEVEQSIFARGAINTDPIPKLGLAEAYYHAPQAKNPFDTKAEGTTLGYRIGFEMGQGLMLVFDRKTVYQNGEERQFMTVETQIRF